MKTTYLILFCIAISTFSCQESKEGKGIYYNDFENMGLWTGSAKIKKGIGRSGNYCIYTDGKMEYSETFRLALGDVKVSNPHFVTASAWVMSNSMAPKSKLVLTIDSAGKNINWIGIQANSVILEPGKWFEIKCKMPIPEKYNFDEQISLYGWSGGDAEVYYDDVLLKIE